MTMLYSRLGVLLIAMVGLTACEQAPAKRQYTETMVSEEPKPGSASVEDPHAFLNQLPQDDIHAGLTAQNLSQMSMGAMGLSGETAAGPSPLAWETPSQWKELPRSGMRLGSFEGSGPVNISVIALGGNAGGVEANIVRWMQQIGLSVPDANALQAFTEKQERLKTAEGWPAVLVDLTQFQKDWPQQNASMIAAIIDGNDTQIFVKMTGSKEAVLLNKKSLIELVESIHANK